MAYTKALLWHGGDSVEEQHLLDSRVFVETTSARDAKEGARAFVERREPRFEDRLGEDMSDWYPWVSAFLVVSYGWLIDSALGL